MGNDKPKDFGPLPLLMISSKRTGGREHVTLHAQRDMPSISPAICRRAGVARIYFFLYQIFFELVTRNEKTYHSYAIHVQESGLYRHSVYTYMTTYVTWYVSTM